MLYLVDGAQIEIEKQKGSRFIAFAVPLQDVQLISMHINRIRDENSKAQHFCYAWRTVDGQSGYSDDGEPHGSAGVPILKPIVGQDIIDILVVVVRYFGGVKLGVGGLVRAYGLACQSVLNGANLCEYIPQAQFSFSYAYDKENAVRKVFSQYTELKLDFDYQAQVQVQVQLPVAHVKQMVSELNEALEGRLEDVFNSDS